MFGLAGITELWNGPDGPPHTVSLITTEPNERMRDIHDCMPVILPREDYAARLDPGNQDFPALKRFIVSYPAHWMEAYPVGKAVSNARNEGAELINPASVIHAANAIPGNAPVRA